MSDIYYVETDDGNVEAFHATETEDDQHEESINTDELPFTADLTEQESTEMLFILNRTTNFLVRRR